MISDVSEQDFQAKVIERSKQVQKQIDLVRKARAVSPITRTNSGGLVALA